ncbi:MAG: PspC domain-containing protein [Candidatus Altiarchaeia archaeon]|jgi:phage shock protein C
MNVLKRNTPDFNLRYVSYYMTHESSEPRRLYRSRDNRVFAGILGGIGEYLNVDPVAIRVLYVIFTAVTGFFPLILAYLIMLFIIPEPPANK